MDTDLSLLFWLAILVPVVVFVSARIWHREKYRHLWMLMKLGDKDKGDDKNGIKGS